MDILVQPLNRLIQAEPGANLLTVLQAAQVPMSYSCMAGRCGTCRCRVRAGEPRGTVDDEAAEVLACQTYLTEACTVEIPEPDEVVVHPARIVKATVVAIEALTHDIRRLLLRPAKPIAYSPGQYVQLQFSPAHARPYSMAGLCDDALLEFHVRQVPGGRVSGYIACDLRVGDAVKVCGPLGSAYLRRQHRGPMLCVAGGTGLAPVLSILRAGLVTEALAQDHGDLAGWRAYLCGSAPMVEAATRLVRRQGIAPAHIHADAFYPQGG